MNKNISVIGGAGFIGTSLSLNLIKDNINHTVYDIDTSQDKTNYIDVTNPETLNVLKNSSTIINLAAVHRDDILPKSRYKDVNVDGAINICNCARNHNINKIIFTSSVAIYGVAPLNTDENGQHNYFNEYGKTKHQAELIYINWFNEDPKNRTLVIIRPTVVFGEGNRGNVFNLLNQIYKKRFFMLGDGSNIKSMAYVGNVSEFIKYSLERSNGLFIHNYVDKPDLKVRELVEIVKKVLNQESAVIQLPIFFGKLAGYFFDFFAYILKQNFSISAIRVKKFTTNSMFSSNIDKTCTYKAPFLLEEGIVRTIKYEFFSDNSNKNY